MPQSQTLHDQNLHATIISFSDRILRGEKTDAPAQACADTLRAAGVAGVTTLVVPEAAHPLHEAIEAALRLGHRLILILGGSGFGPTNVAPEVARTFISVEIPGIAEQIRAHGLTNTPLAGLSRGVVGITARDATGSVIVSSPGSKSGSQDTLTVLIPLLGSIYHQLEAHP